MFNFIAKALTIWERILVNLFGRPDHVVGRGEGTPDRGDAKAVGLSHEVVLGHEGVVKADGAVDDVPDEADLHGGHQRLAAGRHGQRFADTD
jgi:hypothetical protein